LFPRGSSVQGWAHNGFEEKREAVMAIERVFSCWIAEGRKVDLLNFDAAGFKLNHATTGKHLQSPAGLTLCFISTR